MSTVPTPALHAWDEGERKPTSKEATMASDARFADFSVAAEGYQTAHFVLPPPVMIPAPGTGRLRPSVAIGGVCLAEDRVRARATVLAERARRLGATASLRVWREAHHYALAQLAGEAAGLAAGMECLNLTWQHQAGAYYVSATFAPSRTTVH
jgi:hypothetical protein